MKNRICCGLLLSLLLIACEDEDAKYYGKQPANTGGTMELQGGEGGASAKNSVYVDFSNNKQTPVERASWHLALYCGTGFGVKLNSTLGSRATEAKEGTGVDGVISQQEHDAYKIKLSLDRGEGSFDIVDAIGNDLSKTIIQKDRVYIYDSGDAGLELYKVKVTEKNSSTYTVTYALWNSPEVKTLDIIKDTDYDFTGISLNGNKKVDIQPTKEEWDMVWGRNTYISAMAPGIPFIMSEIVFLNTAAGVQAKEMLTGESGSYDDYHAEKAVSLQFSPDIDAIGSRWRNGGSPSTQPSVKTDRFYVIKDAQGNIYKLGFVSMNEGQDGGKRGYPEIKYALLIEAK